MNIIKVFNNYCLWILVSAFLWMGSAVQAQDTRETITYAIKKFKMKAGEASLVYQGPVKEEGKDLHLIVFTSKAPNFYDEERIFVDPKTFFPVMVKRDLNIFGKKEKITEVYDVANGVIRITKEVKGKKTLEEIKKKGVIDNIYCFISRFRKDMDPKPGQSVVMNLPTKDVKINFINVTKIKINDRTYNAFYLESDSREYKVWIDTSPQRIPLRIDGAMGIVSTSMVLSEYKSP